MAGAEPQISRVTQMEQNDLKSKRPSLPGKLKNSYKDNGSIPSYLASFEDAFVDKPTVTKTFRHDLSGKGRPARTTVDQKEQESSTEKQLEPEIDYSTQVELSQSQRSDSTPSLGDVFLEKAQQKQHYSSKPQPALKSKGTLMATVKSSKERWPPNISKSLNLKKSHLPREQTRPDRTETNEHEGRTRKTKATTASSRNKSGESKEKIVELHRKNERERQKDSLSTKMHEISESPSTDDNLSQSSDENDMQSQPPYDDDDSTISSIGISDLRPSYKVCYFGPGALKRGREWEDGLVDASFPSLPVSRRYDDDPLGLDARFDSSGHKCDPPKAPNKRRFASDENIQRDSMPELPMKDRFDSLGGSGDHSLPGVPSNDRRFDKGRSSGAPHKPGRQGSIILPAVWQTRISEQDDSAGLDTPDRKWRLKRVWEMDDEVVDDSEPDYVVTEPHLKQALTALLCAEPSSGEDDEEAAPPTNFGSSRESSAKSSIKQDKYWKMQKVWERRGEVVAIDDAESLAGEAMIQIFESDKHETRDSLVLEYTEESKSPTDEETSHDRDKGCIPSTTDDDSLGIEDLDDGEGSLRSLEESFHDPESLEQKLILVEQEINDAMSNTSNATLTRKTVQRLQQKISMCMEKMEQAELRRYNGSGIGLSNSFASLGEPNEEGSLSSPFDGSRDEGLIRRKLRKTEKMIATLCEEKGEDVKKEKKYRSLLKKRDQYTQELAEISSEFGHSSIISHSSLLYDLEMDIIEEEEEEIGIGYADLRGENEDSMDMGHSHGNESSGDLSRDKELLMRKLRKVEKALLRMQQEQGPDVVTTKKYRQLNEKKEQYQNELNHRDRKSVV